MKQDDISVKWNNPKISMMRKALDEVSKIPGFEKLKSELCKEFQIKNLQCELEDEGDELIINLRGISLLYTE